MQISVETAVSGSLHSCAPYKANRKEIRFDQTSGDPNISCRVFVDEL